MKKNITRKGCRTLAIVWTLAAASMAVAFVRRLAEFNLFLLLMLVLSVFTAAGFWRTWRGMEEEAPRDPFGAPPRFADDPVLFDDDPPQPNDSEENDNAR